MANFLENIRVNIRPTFLAGVSLGLLLSLLLGILIGLLPGVLLGFIVGLLLGLYVWIRDKIQPGYIRRMVLPRFEAWSEWVAAGGPFGPNPSKQTEGNGTSTSTRGGEELKKE